MTKPNLKVIPTVTHVKEFFPCKSCSNILTKECFDDCVFGGKFKHYRQRPGTGIKDLSAFPLEEVLNETEISESFDGNWDLSDSNYRLFTTSRGI